MILLDGAATAGYAQMHEHRRRTLPGLTHPGDELRSEPVVGDALLVALMLSAQPPSAGNGALRSGALSRSSRLHRQLRGHGRRVHCTCYGYRTWRASAPDAAYAPRAAGARDAVSDDAFPQLTATPRGANGSNYPDALHPHVPRLDRRPEQHHVGEHPSSHGRRLDGGVHADGDGHE